MSSVMCNVIIGVFVVVMRAISSEDTTLSSIFSHLVAFQCAFCCIRALFIFDIEFISHFWLIVVFVYSTSLHKKAGCNCHHWVGTLRWLVWTWSWILHQVGGSQGLQVSLRKGLLRDAQVFSLDAVGGFCMSKFSSLGPVKILVIFCQLVPSSSQKG
jgi:hypothetical protein